jgi:hypothetical protein
MNQPTFKAGSLAALRDIVRQDYRVDLSDEEVEQLGLSLLKITRLAMVAFNRAEDRVAAI